MSDDVRRDYRNALEYVTNTTGWLLNAVEDEARAVRRAWLMMQTLAARGPDDAARAIEVARGDVAEAERTTSFAREKAMRALSEYKVARRALPP